jgi:putative ATPase
MQTPLAERMRPQKLDDFIGQEHLVGKDGIIRKIIETAGVIPSFILWGPPGVGKTTLAGIVAQQKNMPFVALSAIQAGVKEVREVIDKAKLTQRTLLFIDEIHRFNKSQQDALLGAVEKGIISLIGATTENPSFEVVGALLSRCQIYTLKTLNNGDLEKMLKRAVETDVHLRKKTIRIIEMEALFEIGGGDARKILNLFELVVEASPEEIIDITDEKVIAIAQQKVILYDKNGEMHYNIISAFIKSIRGSDPNAAVYWLARMIEGGEDVKFIARRLVILASEDIGNANPTALVMATNGFQAVNVIGYPEAEIILAQIVTYLASSPKSNASYQAIKTAKILLQEKGNLSVPIHLRNAPTKLMRDLNYGKGYQYAHDSRDNFVHQEYMPQEIANTVLYKPGKNAREQELRTYLKRLWGEKYGY